MLDAGEVSLWVTLVDPVRSSEVARTPPENWLELFERLSNVVWIFLALDDCDDAIDVVCCVDCDEVQLASHVRGAWGELNVS